MIIRTFSVYGFVATIGLFALLGLIVAALLAWGVVWLALKALVS